MRSNLQKRLDAKLALKRANRKHEPTLEKLVIEALNHLNESKSWKSSEAYLRESDEEWYDYCLKNKGNITPQGEAFIDNIIIHMAKSRL